MGPLGLDLALQSDPVPDPGRSAAIAPLFTINSDMSRQQLTSAAVRNLSKTGFSGRH